MGRFTIPALERLQVRPMEAAELLSISDRHLRRLTERGEIPAIGRGRMRRYCVRDLEAWIEQQRED